MSILLDEFARVRRDAPSKILIHALSEGRSLSADVLWEEYRVIVGIFERTGLLPGDLIVAITGNRAAFVSILLASLATRVRLMPADRGTTASEAGGLVARWGAAGLIVPDPEPFHSLGSAVPLPGGLTLLRLARGAEQAHYGAAAVLKLTSGSTGEPKATLTSEHQLHADGAHIVEAMGIEADDVQLAAIPMSHSYGLGNLVLPLLIQGTSLVLRDGFVPVSVPRDAIDHGIRVFPGVPFMFDHLLEHLDPGDFPPVLDVLITAGARIEPRTLVGFKARFGRKIHSFYGASETGGISYDASEEVSESPTVGHRMPGTHVTLRPVDGLAEPGVGRVHVAGAAVAGGYAGAAGASESGFVDGGFLTGDLGSFDAQGRLALVGRVSEFVNVAGRKVHPEEVERVLRQMPQIADVRVLGTDDGRRGQILVACVVPRGDAVRAVTIRNYCAQRLSPHKIPRAFIMLSEIPLDGRGKTDRRAIEAIVARHLPGE